MIMLVPELNLVQQMLQLFLAAVHIAHKDESLPLLRKMLLIHVLHLYHVLEVWAQVAAIAHRRCLVHQLDLVPDCGAPWPKVCAPA
jgi:hypothetical protein